MRIPYTFYLVCYENRLANQGLRTPQKVALDIPIFFNKKRDSIPSPSSLANPLGFQPTEKHSIIVTLQI